MRSRSGRNWVLWAGLFALATGVVDAWAQERPVRVRGTIEQVEGNTLSVTARNGTAMTVRLADGARIVAIVRASLGDITPGSFIGTTAAPEPDGTLHALEIHIFPESMRGTGEGHRAWDLGPTTTMTNGTVAQSVDKVDGNTLTVKYREDEKSVVVTPQTEIVTYAPGDRTDLRVGAKIFVTAAIRQADGSLMADRVNVGRAGVTPPM